MRTSWKLSLAVLLWAGLALAQDKLTLGVYLPVSVDDREAQFKFGEQLAAGLSKGMGAQVVSRTFARYEDFAKASSDGTLAMAVSEGFIFANSKGEFATIAQLTQGGDSNQRFAVVAERRTSVGNLGGKRLAMVKGPGGTEGQFLSNVVFGGDLPPSHFKLVFVPTVESGIKAIGAKTADAALVPAHLAPKDLPVVYRSGRITGALLVNLSANEAQLRSAAGGVGALAPFGKPAVVSADVVGDLRRRIARVPGRRLPFIAESPVYRINPGALAAFKSVGPVFPAFVEFIEVSKEQPDD